MAVETAKEMAERFSRMPADEVIVYTFWTKDDVEIPLSDLDPKAKAEDYWESVADDVSDALENCIGQVNDVLYEALVEALDN